MATKAERRTAYEARRRAGDAMDLESVLARGSGTSLARRLAQLTTARTVDGARRRRLRRSVSRWARFQANAWWFPFGVGMLLLGTGRLIGALDAEAVYVPLFFFVVLPGLAVLALLLAWSVIGVRRDLARERAWQDALPFELVDYEDCLGDPPDRSDDHVHLLLTFVDAAPPEAELLRLLAADEGTWTVKGPIITRSPGPTGYSDKHNLRFVTWFHDFAAVLARLDERAPLVEVRLLNEVWDDC